MIDYKALIIHIIFLYFEIGFITFYKNYILLYSITEYFLIYENKSALKIKYIPQKCNISPPVRHPRVKPISIEIYV